GGGLSLGCMRLPEVAGGNHLVVARPKRLPVYRLRAARRRGGRARFRRLVTCGGFPLAGAIEHPVKVFDIGLPAGIFGVAMPVGKFGGVGELEYDRTVARLDDGRHKLVAAVGKGSLRADPARRHGPRRPQDDDGPRVAKALLDHLVERLSRMKRRVPPDTESFRGEPFRENSRSRPVLASVGNEDVSSGQTTPWPDRAGSLATGAVPSLMEGR